MSYCLEENHFAFKDYIAIYSGNHSLSGLKVAFFPFFRHLCDGLFPLSAQFRATEEGKKTIVNWSYEVEPVEGYTAEMMATGMSAFYTTFLQDLERQLKGSPRDSTLYLMMLKFSAKSFLGSCGLLLQVLR